MLDRLAQAEAMGLDDYRADLAERTRIRGVYNSLVTQCAPALRCSPGRRAGRPWLDWRSRVCRAVLVARGAGDLATIAA